MITIGLMLIAWLLIFARAVDRDLNHDEHQFLAPAALMSREGLQPWRDFPLYHLPNLVFAYALADRLTGDLVLGAKLVNFIASVGLIAALMLVARKRNGFGGIVLGLFAIILLLSDPLFRYTAGKTWNHEVPTALILAACGCLIAAMHQDRMVWTVFAGIFGGLAAGCRLTFAPTLVGLFVFCLLNPIPWRRRLLHAAILTLSATAALSPSLYYLGTEFDRFVFSNFEFPRLRLIDPNNTRIQKTATYWRKVRYFLKEIVLPSWPVFLFWATTAIRPGWQWLRTRRLGNLASGLWLLMFPFVLIGCFAPSRYQYQHFFIFIPLSIMAGVCASVKRSEESKHGRVVTLAAAVVCLIPAFRGASDYSSIRTVFEPDEWFSSRIKRTGGEIRVSSGEGRVLTLAPTIPLAGSLGIYPELCTGAFGWRSAALVPRARRSALHLVAPEDLDAYLEAKQPIAVLTGVEEPREEEPLVEWARRNGFKPLPLKKKRMLWVPPARF